METNKETTQIGIRVITTENPKPNAPEYTIRTIEEMFDVITAENLDRFLSDFDTATRAAIHLREAVKSMAEITGATVTNKDMGMDHFVWIDD